MNKKKVTALVLIVLAIGVAVYWWVAGASIWTMTEIPVEVKDDVFDTTYIKWEEGFRPGLEYIGPIVGVLLVAAAVLLWMARRDRKRLAGADTGRAALN